MPTSDVPTQFVSPWLPAGVRVGHAAARGGAGLSGTSAVVLPPGTVVGVDCRGGGPATHETNILAPGTLGYGADAVVLTGGSAFGLAAARGVQDELATRNIGCTPVPGARVPIVPAAAIFDLNRTASALPGVDTGRAATQAALDSDSPQVPRGSVGAGLGAFMGRGLARGGFGVASVVTDAGWHVTVLVVANPMGSVFAYSGDLFATGVLAQYGLRVPALSPAVLAEQVERAQAMQADSGAHDSVTNTTIACVLTDAPLTDAQVTRVAASAHAGLARAIYPSHTLFDGDTIFAASVPHDTWPAGSLARLRDYRAPDLTFLGVAAADAMTLACVDAVCSASPDSASSVPALREFAPDLVQAWDEVRREH